MYQIFKALANGAYNCCLFQVAFTVVVWYFKSWVKTAGLRVESFTILKGKLIKRLKVCYYMFIQHPRDRLHDVSHWSTKLCWNSYNRDWSTCHVNLLNLLCVGIIKISSLFPFVMIYCSVLDTAACLIISAVILIQHSQFYANLFDSYKKYTKIYRTKIYSCFQMYKKQNI